MGQVWRIYPHDHGPWMVVTDRGRMMVTAALGRRLQPLDGRRPHRDEVRRVLEYSPGECPEALVTYLLEPRAPHRPGARQRPALWGRFPLVSAAWTRRLARPLEPWTGGRTLSGLALGIISLPALIFLAPLPPVTGWGDGLAGLMLFLAGGLIHELAHAAALSAQGYPAGGIGGGVLFILPVLHCDVSAVSLLPRRGRLRVDLAGVILQAVWGLGLGLWGWLAGWGGGTLAARLSLLAVGWSLIPFMRADGYYALGDGLGIDQLDRALPAGRGRRALAWGLSYKALNILFLILVAGLVPWRWSGILGAWVWLVGAGMALLVAWRLPALVRGLISDGRSWRGNKK